MEALSRISPNMDTINVHKEDQDHGISGSLTDGLVIGNQAREFGLLNKEANEEQKRPNYTFAYHPDVWHWS